MGKIPQINLNDRPSAAVGRGGIDTSAGQMISAAGDIVRSGLDRAVREEQRLQEVMKRKQQIVDTINAGKIANDFEEQSFSVQEMLKERHADDPDKAIAEYIEEMNSRSDEAIKNAPNDQVRQHLASETQNQISSGQRQLHEWVSARQTQKAKSDVSSFFNTATAGAERITDIESLNAYLEEQKSKAEPYFQLVYGKNTGAELAKLKTQITRAYAIQRSDKDPYNFSNQLKEVEGPLAEYLDVDQRDDFRKRAKQAAFGRGQTREFEIIAEGAARRDKAVALYNGNQFDGATEFSMRNALEEQQKLLLNPGYTEYSPEQKERQLKLVEKQLELITALGAAHRRGKNPNAIDDPETLMTLLHNQDVLYGKEGNGGGDLAEWQKYQTQLTIALADGKITQGTYNTMLKPSALAFPTAAGNEAERTSHWLFFKDAREAGNAALEDIIEKKAPKLDAKTRAKISLSYIRALNEAIEAGGTPKKEDAIRMAIERFYVETHTPLPTGRPR